MPLDPPEPEAEQIEVLSQPNKGGRPQIEIDIEQVEKLAAIGCTLEEMGHVLASKPTLVRRLAEPDFKEAIQRGRSMGKQSVRHKQFQAAMDGNPTMLIWLGKQMLGQRDEQRIVLTPQTAEEWWARLTPEQRETEKARLQAEAARETLQ